MKMHYTRTSLAPTVLALFALLATVTLPALAEVGVIELGPANPYLMRSIVDDPDPQVWTRYNQDSETRKVLNDGGAANGDGPPSMLSDQASGEALVAWSKNSPSGFDVVLSRFDGLWSAPVVLASTAADELDPFLLQDPSTGAVHLFYWVLDGAPRVMHRQAPADLSSWTAATVVSQPGEIASRPGAVFHNGVLHLTYESHGSTYGSLPRAIVLAEQGSGTFTSQIVATSSYDGPHRPEVHSKNGKLWVDWIDDADEMTWRRATNEGSWEPIELEIFQTAEERDFHVRGAIKAEATEE